MEFPPEEIALIVSAIGNHEFDYRLSRLEELVDMMDTKPVCCNFQKVGEETHVTSPILLFLTVMLTLPSTEHLEPPAPRMASPLPVPTVPPSKTMLTFPPTE